MQFFTNALVFATVAIASVAAYGGSSSGGYSSGGSRGGSSSYGGSSSSYGGSSGSFGGSFGGSTGSTGSVVGNAGPVQAAVRSRHTIEYVDVDLPQDIVQPQIVDVDAGVLPLVLNFKSASSRIQVHQSHQGAEPGDIQETTSEDEPQLLKHEVTKPIIQEVREIITPFRRVVQEIRPVEEEVKTIVSRGKGRRQDAGDFNNVQKNTGGIGGGISGGRGGYGGSGGAYGSASFGGARAKSY